jgi:hypothetical protein
LIGSADRAFACAKLSVVPTISSAALVERLALGPRDQDFDLGLAAPERARRRPRFHRWSSRRLARPHDPTDVTSNKESAMLAAVGAAAHDHAAAADQFHDRIAPARDYGLDREPALGQ